MIGGELDASVAHAREALPRLAESGDRQTEASCLSNLAWSLLYRGRRAEGEPGILRALEAARAIGARAQEAYAHAAAGELVEAYGEWGRAFTEGETGLAIARELGHREWMAAALSLLGRMRRNCGDIARRASVPRGDAGDRARASHHTMARRCVERARPGPDRRGRDRRRDPPPRRGDPSRSRSRAVRRATRRRSHWPVALRTGQPAEALGHLARLELIASQFTLYMLDARRAGGRGARGPRALRRGRGADPRR